MDAGAVARPRGSKLKNNYKCLNLYRKTSCIRPLSLRHTLPPSLLNTELSVSLLAPSLPPSLRDVRGVKLMSTLKRL